ncbi:MAG: VOC family protein [Acidimicrobiales bacterium]
MSLPADWRVLGDRIEATFVAASFSDGARFLPRIGEPGRRADHHPDVDLRYPRRSAHQLGHPRPRRAHRARCPAGRGPVDRRRRGRFCAASRRWRSGLRSSTTPTPPPFWVALLAYRELRPADGDGPVRLVDARRISPPLRFGPDRAEDRPPGLAIRLDVAADVAAERVAAAVEAGGCVVEQRPEEGTWLLADPTGVLVELLVPPA